MEFDLTKICHQGAYISTMTPLALSDYLSEPVVPTISRYHMTGYPQALIQLLTQLDVWFIVEQYLRFSIIRNMHTVIDLCLPYYDRRMKKIFLGRYIIFRGQLLGIRLCTQGAPGFNRWPRYRTQVIKTPLCSQTVIGEFTIALKNIRISLLFYSQLPYHSNQYLNNSYDLITLTPNCHITQLMLLKKNELSMRHILIESQALTVADMIGKEEVDYLAQGIIPEAIKNRIVMDYYAFDLGFARKQFGQLSMDHLLKIDELSIPVYWAQRQSQTLPYLSHPEYIYTNSTFPELTDKKSIKSFLQVHIGRLLTLFSIASFSKLILVLEDSLTTLCFLFFLAEIRESSSYPCSQIANLFSTVRLMSKQLGLLLRRVDLFNDSFPVDGAWITSNKSLEASILEQLEQIQAGSIQDNFVVISNNNAMVSVAQLLNKRSQRQFADQMKPENTMKNWLVSQFFSKEEVKSITQSAQFIEFVSSQEYLLDICRKLKPEKQLKMGKGQIQQMIDLQMGQLQLDYLLNKIHLQLLLQSGNPLLYGYSKWYIQLNLPGPIKSKYLYSYLIRKVKMLTYTSLTRSQHNHHSNMIEIMLTLPKQRLQQLFTLLKKERFCAKASLMHSMALNQNLYHQIQYNSQSQGWCLCHHCGYQYPTELIYQCNRNTAVCKESFCYGCLFMKFGYTPAQLANGKSPNIRSGQQLKSCPKCRGLCSQECLKCRQTMISSFKSQQAKQQQDECHICCRQKSISMFRCTNPQCKKIFCVACLHILNEDLSKAYEQSWICAVCSRMCNCNSCQSYPVQCQTDSRNQQAKHAKINSSPIKVIQNVQKTYQNQRGQHDQETNLISAKHKKKIVSPN